MKTVHRLFTVSGVLVTVFILFVTLTPLSFASMLSGNTNRVKMNIDSKRPYLTNYFYGTNSGMIDCRTSGGWYRFIFDNTSTNVTVINSSGQAYIWFNPSSSDNDLYLYRYYIGSSYSSISGTNSWTTYLLTQTQEFQLSSSSPQIYYFNCGIENGVNGSQTITSTSSVYPNAYYPIMEQASVNVEVIVDNQASIASSQDQADNSRYSAQQSADNSRQSEIMDAGSDITVSTIDDWVGGNNGLAGKLTELAATLSSNADIFSQNQSQNQANLSKAGEFVGSVFNQIPTGITAAAVCFLIILIAVKVVGR